MSIRSLMIAAPLALAAGTMIAAPVSAQGYWGPGEMQREFHQLERQIDRLAQGRELTNGELRRMYNAVDALRDIYHRSARDGFTYREVAALNDRIDNVRYRIRQQSRDGDILPPQRGYRY